MLEDLRNRIVAAIRADLADEAARGFPLVGRFPNSETAGLPAYFDRLSAEERDRLLNALALHATHQWSYAFNQELQADPVVRGLRYLKPLYPEGDWYGGRPKKTALKKAVAQSLVENGYVRVKLETPGAADVMKFAHPDPEFQGWLSLFFDPGFPRQVDFGFRNWLRADLLREFPPLAPRDIIPALSNLNYDLLWRGSATSNPICWDVITEANLDETLDTLVETLARLTALAKRVNAISLMAPA